MLSFRLSKKIAFLALVVLAFFSACRDGRNKNAETNAAEPLVAEGSTGEIPFSTKEPDDFQAEIVISANGTERKTFVARSGAKRRSDFGAGAKNQVSSLSTDKNFLILPDKKIYAENADAENVVSIENWTDFLTNEWLNARSEVAFEKLETAGNTTKYLVKPENAGQTEILIFVDDAHGFPVRQEFYSVSGDRRILNFAVELRNLKIPADESTFAVPPDYKKVSMDDLRKILRSLEN